MLLIIKDKIILWMKHFTVTCVPKHNHTWQREAKLSIQQWQPNNKQQPHDSTHFPLQPSFSHRDSVSYLQECGKRAFHLALTAHVLALIQQRVAAKVPYPTGWLFITWLCIDRHQHWAGKAGIIEDGRNWEELKDQGYSGHTDLSLFLQLTFSFCLMLLLARYTVLRHGERNSGLSADRSEAPKLGAQHLLLQTAQEVFKSNGGSMGKTTKKRGFS